jgi:phosphatidylinositol glycan class Z
LDLVEFWWRVWDIYWLFLLLRVLLAVIPTNSGYIHPDEHFQSTEVVLGDVLELDTHRTWEFNISAPLRSPSLPFLLYGLPIGLLKQADLYLDYKLGIQLFIGPYVLQLVPRLIMLLLSFSVDFTVYQICKLYKHSYNQCLTTLASSYIMLIYSTRTFRYVQLLSLPHQSQSQQHNRAGAKQPVALPGCSHVEADRGDGLPAGARPGELQQG